MDKSKQISSGAKRIYFKNEYAQRMFLKINGMSVTVNNGAWIDVYGNEINVQISGDFDYKDDLNDLVSTASSLKERLAARAGKWVINLVDDYSLKAVCTYRINNITDGETVTIALNDVEVGSHIFSSMGMIVLFPSVKRNSGAELISAYAAENDKTIKKYSKLGYDGLFLIDFLFSFLFYPIRKLYFKRLCSDESLTKNIKNADELKERSEKRANRKSHPILATMLVITILAAGIIGFMIYTVDESQPALISSNGQTITLDGDIYEKGDMLPENAKLITYTDGDKWIFARTEGFSKPLQFMESAAVQKYEDTDGNTYLWFVEDYTNTISTDLGEKNYNDFDTHIIYKCTKNS